MKTGEREKGVLILPQTYPPDMGGVETHLADLTQVLEQKPGWRAWIVAYKPIVTRVEHYLPREVRGAVTIRRFWWIGGNLFRVLEPYPVLMALYIIPYFFVRLFFYMLPKMHKVDVIHVHGINMVVVGLLMGTLFRKRVVFQSHALYTFKPGSLFARVVAFLLNRVDAKLALCAASKKELVDIGVDAKTIEVYRYWIDLARFTPIERPAHARFNAFFIGRLIGIKGEEIVIELARRFPQVDFTIAGGGPNQQVVEVAARALPNLRFLGLVPNDQTRDYYRAADVVLVPSQYAEGFGRVICEALACGTPVIATRAGGIPDAMDETVGVLCDMTFESYAAALARMLHEPAWYAALKNATRAYAERQFSTRNAEVIFSHYL